MNKPVMGNATGQSRRGCRSGSAHGRTGLGVTWDEKFASASARSSAGFPFLRLKSRGSPASRLGSCLPAARVLCAATHTGSVAAEAELRGATRGSARLH